jgi:hypothetical protein
MNGMVIHTVGDRWDPPADAAHFPRLATQAEATA